MVGKAGPPAACSFGLQDATPGQQWNTEPIHHTFKSHKKQCFSSKPLKNTSNSENILPLLIKSLRQNWLTPDFPEVDHMKLFFCNFLWFQVWRCLRWARPNSFVQPTRHQSKLSKTSWSLWGQPRPFLPEFSFCFFIPPPSTTSSTWESSATWQSTGQCATGVNPPNRSACSFPLYGCFH